MNSASNIAIVGWSCRLPGAASVTGLWELLMAGRCSVTQIPPDRWSLEKLGHPRGGEKGKSYTWAAGVLDNIWGFDPMAFGLSPREAEQMDPQQRLMLELTWEALEDSRMKPSSVAGSRTGVFIGASALDYGNLRILDIASGDAYFATGNTLSIISNRISYVFDLHGPSLTIDTACSSALVALNEAVHALQSGRIDTAIIGGVNILASPFGFIGFSQASMLSRRGLCQAFSAQADGYVRAEGGVVMVLTTEASALASNRPIHGLIAGSQINSDGRTAGISLPSSTHQAALLRELYGRLDINPDQLAFIEAHGTGTLVGDPIEAKAVGQTLGVRRRERLLIGSIKTNIGHMEAASGLAGVLKASLALKHKILPASLHSAELNPHIDFDALNLRVCQHSTALPASSAQQLAGVNSFGFGGTNAHVILAEPPAKPVPFHEQPASYLILSAHSRGALSSLIDEYAAQMGELTDAETSQLVTAVAHRRDRLRERLVVPYKTRDQLAAALSGVSAETRGANDFALATALENEANVAFVYSGNGGQWAGMGLFAYQTNKSFKTQFDLIDEIFTEVGGWSLAKMLHSPELTERLKLTSVAQPLIFAIQAAVTHALKSEGLHPAFVLGHSVGEVAAAEAAGILDVANAVRVIHFRSVHQERVQGHGSMAVVIGSEASIGGILKDLPGLEIAAHNDFRAYTLAGDRDSIAALVSVARRHKARVRPLDFAYPFHTAHMEPVREPLLRDLANLEPLPAIIPFISTVTGTELSGRELDASYWWRNVREPVLFRHAVQETARRGARLFVEIGPDVVLLPHINGLAEADNLSIAALNVIGKDDKTDPIRKAFAKALAFGAKIDPRASFGMDHYGDVTLAPYPWQRQNYRLPESPESSELISPVKWHALTGSRAPADRFDWRSTIDTDLVPELADHQINGQVILPGAAFVEMALAVACDWLNLPAARIADLEILQPMYLSRDSSREVICHVVPELGRIEISSRPRLGRTPWQLHAAGKIIKDANAAAIETALPARPAKGLEALDVYKIANGLGLQFGPLFQNLSFAGWVSESVMRVDLCVDARDVLNDASDYLLDPARLDSCFHGLILLFGDLITQGQKKAFVPVRFGEINLSKQHVSIASARLEIVSANERCIIANYILYDRDETAFASLRQVRYQAVPVMQPNELAANVLIQKFVLAPEPAACRLSPPLNVAKLSDLARAHRQDDDGLIPPAHVLLEGWATAASWELFQSFAQAGKIDIPALVKSCHLASGPEAWIENLAAILRQSGLITQDGSTWRLCEESNLPARQEIFQTFVADHPEFAAELLLMSWTNATISALILGDFAAFTRSLSNGLIENFELGGVQQRDAADLLIKLLKGAALNWPKDRALRILQIGYGPLSSRAALLAQDTDSHLTVFEPEKRRLERARLFFGEREDVAFMHSLADLPHNGFDLVIAADALYRLFPDNGDWLQLRNVLADGALVCAVEPLPTLFRDIVFGREAHWFRQTAAGQWTGAVSGRQILLHNMALAGLKSVEVERVSVGEGAAFLAIGQFTAEPHRSSAAGNISIIVDEDLSSSAISASLATLLTAAGLHVLIVHPADIPSLQGNSASGHQTGQTAEVIFLSGLFETELTSLRRLTDTCLSLKQFAAQSEGRKAKLWLVTAGSCEAQFEPGVEQAAGLWALSRTFANEFPTLDIRRVAIAKDMPAEAIAGRLRHLVLSGTNETDISLSLQRTDVLRFEGLNVLKAAQARAEALRLERGLGTGMDRISWTGAERQAPDAEDVEIEVEATGLNFRDVMWGLGILPEEILENGFAGPALGLECSGRVLRIGSKVNGIKPGDHVVAFAKHGFATHATLPAAMVMRRPAGLSAEAAATIPVAFLTAYYSLVTCARLKPREWILIHGGAGGVGLAALQIALWRGARVISTAGSEEKRALLTGLGAEHVFDSRSGVLFDEVRRAVPEGVHVVLNSLSGEAMERSIGVLRPFGRFVELGKRDFVANTHIGLRPFSRNLTYFGVDLDQLMLHDKNAARKLFADVMKLFDKGHLTPLPYRSFAAEETVDALRLMQQSGHIGKLVIRPPKRAAAGQENAVSGFEIASDKAHLVTGGLGGFGLETARWLVDRGARHIVLTGRNCTLASETEALLAGFSKRGVKTEILACDVADKDDMKRLFARFGKDLKPLAGVFHEAMVLDDAIIPNLTVEKIERVLRPKITGAEILDRMTRHLALDYFVLFSSATTLVGNPGQAAYVMANGFLEGLARRRRKGGLPALAIAWGAIEDVGILARKSSVRDSLAKRVGVQGIKAREGLDLMAETLKLLPADQESAVIAIAPIDWASARQHLAVLNSPTYTRLPRHETEFHEHAQLDIRSLLTQKTQAEVSKLVADEIIEQIAKVLRLPREDVARNKPLAEIGLDSLMAVELALALEQRFGLGGPMTSLASGLTAMEVADHVIALLTDSVSEQDAYAKGLAERHLGSDFDAKAIGNLKDRVFEKSDTLKDILP